jgi:hypothetical protein
LSSAGEKAEAEKAEASSKDGAGGGCLEEEGKDSKG